MRTFNPNEANAQNNNNRKWSNRAICIWLNAITGPWCFCELVWESCDKAEARRRHASWRPGLEGTSEHTFEHLGLAVRKAKANLLASKFKITNNCFVNKRDREREGLEVGKISPGSRLATLLLKAAGIGKGKHICDFHWQMGHMWKRDIIICCAFIAFGSDCGQIWNSSDVPVMVWDKAKLRK